MVILIYFLILLWKNVIIVKRNAVFKIKENKMTKKEKGTQFELYVAYLFKEIYPYARPTKGSGNKGEIGDVNQPYFIIECKSRDTESISIKEKVWNKLCAELPIQSKRLPLYLLRNKNNKNWAVLKLEDFIEIFKRSIKWVI